MAEKQGDQVVVDVGGWEWSEMVKKEDWWAIWLGFFILIMGVIIYFPTSGGLKEKLDEIEAKYGQEAQKTDKFKTIGWYQLNDAKKGVRAKNSDIGKWLSNYSKKPHSWKTNPLDATRSAKSAFSDRKP